MDDEEDDDLYGMDGNAEIAPPGNGIMTEANIKQENIQQQDDQGDDDGEDMEEDDSDSDIDIITERKPGIKPDTTPQAPRAAEVSQSQNEAVATISVEKAPRPATIKREVASQAPSLEKPGHEYPEVHTSTIDINGDPIYAPAEKPVTELDFDADLAEHDKPWRRPGADQTDFFNYGFDEFTWATYCLKQKMTRDGIKDAKNETAQFQMMFDAPPMPGMPGVGVPAGGMVPGGVGGPAAVAPQAPPVQLAPGMPGMGGGMPGVPDMTPDMMNAMMQQMMSSGMDPSQLDFGTFMQQYQQMQGGMPQAPQQQQGFQGQVMGYGGVEVGRNQGNYGNNRGRGRRW